MYLQKFPTDVQKCSLVMESCKYHTINYNSSVFNMLDRIILQRSTELEQLSHNHLSNFLITLDYLSGVCVNSLGVQVHIHYKQAFTFFLHVNFTGAS